MMDIENIRNIVTKKLILLETKFGYKMPRIHKEINDELERNSHYSHVPQFSSHSNWGKIRNGNGNYNVDWWLELETIIDAVTLKASTRINSKNEIIKTDSSARKKIIWGLTKFQDTIIPVSYTHLDVYKRQGLYYWHGCCICLPICFVPRCPCRWGAGRRLFIILVGKEGCGFR